MSKGTIVALVVAGLICLILAPIFSHVFGFIGLVLIVAGLYFGFGPDGILKKGQVKETWGTMIEKAHGKAEDVFNDSEFFINDSKVPNLSMARKSMTPGIVTGLIGKSRDFLTIRDHGNYRLQPYQIYVNARDYGENLVVSWHLLYKPTLLQSLLLLLPYVNVIPATLADLDLFDESDLRSYLTNIDNCVFKAVEKTAQGLGQDTSKINRKSKGFLGIS
ncbi:MAG TPA: hypothetical protein VGK27_05565 [Candidatus Deferrimicrobiaceae bacterium]|jgi:hypothetical protein